MSQTENENKNQLPLTDEAEAPNGADISRQSVDENPEEAGVEGLTEPPKTEREQEQTDESEFAECSQTVPLTEKGATERAPQGDAIASKPDGTPAKKSRKTLYAGLAIYLVCLVVLMLFGWDRTFRRSDHPHFVYLADAYLHGKIHIEKPPPWMDDYVNFDNKWWVTFPPAPAIMMAPGVAACSSLHFDRIPVVKQVLCGVPKKDALAGHPYFNDTLFTMLMGALNGLLVWLLLERLRLEKYSSMTQSENLWLTFFFVFGTMHFYCSILGQVWYSALIIGATLTLMYILFAWDAEHPFLAGLCLAAAFATRTPAAMAFPLFFYFLFFKGYERRRRPWREVIVKTLWFGAPILIGVTLMGLQNYYSFHSPFKFGHDYIMQDRHLRHGLFGYQWFSRNLSAALTNLPRISLDEKHIIKFSFHGASMLFTTPAWIYMFWPKKTGKLFWIFALCAALIALPDLLYKSTGFGQFGYRYNIDFAPMMIVCLALAGRSLKWHFKALIIISIFWATFGAVTFRRYDDLFYHYDFFPEMPFSRE